jgi:hypothetical protein
MKTIAGACLALALLGISASSHAATPAPGSSPSPTDRAAVLAVVQKFFDAMAAADAEALRATTVPTFQFHAVRNDAKGTAVSRRTLDEFVARFDPSKERVLERMWDPTVLVHGCIATVWTPYDFHRDGKFTHTGIDVFTLARTDTGWKILDLAFTIEPNAPSQHPGGAPAVTTKK